MGYRAIWTWNGRFAIKALSFLLLLAELSPASDDSLSLPRYGLEVGQELVYELTASEDPRESNGAKNEGRAAARDQMQWRIVVARKNDDGSWRLYIRTKVSFVNPDGSPRGEHDSLGYCDLRPDGSYSLDEQTAVFKKLFPYQLFVRLPDTSAASLSGWEYEPPVYAGQSHQTLPTSASATIATTEKFCRRTLVGLVAQRKMDAANLSSRFSLKALRVAILRTNTASGKVVPPPILSF